MALVDLPIITYFDVARFKQFNPTDSANWTIVPSELGKKKVASYPAMGRRHIRFLNQNRLNFSQEARNEFKTVNYCYFVVGNSVIRSDRFFNETVININTPLDTLAGDIFFTSIVSGSITFVCFVDGVNLYVYREDTQDFGIATIAGGVQPTFIATFGSRIVISSAQSSTFYLSQILLGNPTGSYSTFLANIFVVPGETPNVFAQEVDYIRQFAVLNNTLYIFTAYCVGLWSDVPSSVTDSTGATSVFPWKKNSTVQFNVGLADNAANTIDVSFGRIAWLGQYENGLPQIMSTTGNAPEVFENEAMDVLIQRIINYGNDNPNQIVAYDGFLYEYENRQFYRISCGQYNSTQLLDRLSASFSCEFNFQSKTWSRCIEANGGRNRIRKHMYFGNRHLVTVQGDTSIYEMSGRYYTNETRNLKQSDSNAANAYTIDPMRYEAVTPIITIKNFDDQKIGYAEFKTAYLEIDFVFGESFINYSEAPFENTKYLIAENPGVDGEPQYFVSETDPNTFIIAEDGNYPTTESSTYNTLLKPHIELYISDDGGITYESADVRVFSVAGKYRWRMRWYELGISRNRCYLLVCVSPVPVVPLGGTMEGEEVSGGAD